MTDVVYVEWVPVGTLIKALVGFFFFTYLMHTIDNCRYWRRHSASLLDCCLNVSFSIYVACILELSGHTNKGNY